MKYVVERREEWVVVVEVEAESVAEARAKVAATSDSGVELRRDFARALNSAGWEVTPKPEPDVEAGWGTPVGEGPFFVERERKVSDSSLEPSHRLCWEYRGDGWAGDFYGLDDVKLLRATYVVGNAPQKHLSFVTLATVEATRGQLTRLSKNLFSQIRGLRNADRASMRRWLATTKLGSKTVDVATYNRTDESGTTCGYEFALVGQDRALLNIEVYRAHSFARVESDLLAGHWAETSAIAEQVQELLESLFSGLPGHDAQLEKAVFQRLLLSSGLGKILVRYGMSWHIP